MKLPAQYEIKKKIYRELVYLLPGETKKVLKLVEFGQSTIFDLFCLRTFIGFRDSSFKE